MFSSSRPFTRQLKTDGRSGGRSRLTLGWQPTGDRTVPVPMRFAIRCESRRPSLIVHSDGSLSLPSLVRRITTALYPAHSDDRPFESGTLRGQRKVSPMSLSTHPALSPSISVPAKKTGPSPRPLWVDLRVDSRGGSDAPCGRKRRPRPDRPGRRSSPAGRRSPLVTIRDWRRDLRLHGPDQSSKNVSHAAQL